MTDRTLVLLRHAKAEPLAGKPDIERGLTERGRTDAAAAGAWLGREGHRPELVICSPARRARETWQAVAVALGEVTPEVRYEPAVYEGSTADLLNLVRSVPDEVSSVLLIGHNPTISQLSALLAPDSGMNSGGMDSGGLRTAGVAVHPLPSR